MWYVANDHHKRHLTICVRDEQGNIVRRRQVSTGWYEVRQFFCQLRDDASPHGGYVVIMEVCGFNGWLIKRLPRWGCQAVYLVKAPERVRQKTDRRDAAKLSELLWLNRDRIARGESLVHVKEVYQPTDEEQYDRELTRLRDETVRMRTQARNAIKAVLRRHNLEQDCPTKGLFTQQGLQWLATVSLPEMDRIKLNMLLDRHRLYVSQVAETDKRIHERARRNPRVTLLRTLPRIGEYTALALLAYIGPIWRFPKARSLANFFGLTPGSRDSGDVRRPGSITKAGHPFVRYLLGQMVLHALRGDAGLRRWYQRIKRRRGTNIARVAVMRRLCESIWHMLRDEEPYQPVGTGDEPTGGPKADAAGAPKADAAGARTRRPASGRKTRKVH